MPQLQGKVNRLLPSAGTGPTLIQSAQSALSSTTTVSATINPSVQGSTLFAIFATNGPRAMTSVTSTAGPSIAPAQNGWTRITNLNNAVNGIDVWYWPNNPGNITTVNGTYGASAGCALTVLEYTDLGPLLSSSTSSGAGTGTVTITTATSKDQYNLTLVCGAAGSGSPQSYTTSTGFTKVVTDMNSTSNTSLTVQQRTTPVDPQSTASFSSTLGVGSFWAAETFTFQYSPSSVIRTARYNELFSIPLGNPHYGECQGGSYNKLITAGPDTGLSFVGQSAFSATAPFILMRAPPGVRIVMDYIRIITLGTSTSNTRVETLFAVDRGDRFSSGGFRLTSGGSSSAINNANMDRSNNTIYAPTNLGNNIISGNEIYLSAGGVTITTAAETAFVKRLSRAQLRIGVMAAFEEYILTFGNPTCGESQDLQTANANRYMTDLGPVMAGTLAGAMGGVSLLMYLWFPGQTVLPSFELEMAWLEYYDFTTGLN